MQLINELIGRSQSVYEETHNTVDLQAVEKYYQAADLWIRNTPVPTRPILTTAWFEAGILTETSIFLALHGFYEQGVAALRMQIDGFLVRMYWDTIDKNGELAALSIEERLSSGYWKWEKGEAENYPRPTEDVFSTLRQEKHFQAYDAAYQLVRQIRDQTRRLDKFIHGRPPGRLEPGATRSNRINIRYEKKHFDSWFTSFSTIYDLMSIVTILLYPPYLECSTRSQFVFLDRKVLHGITVVANA